MKSIRTALVVLGAVALTVSGAMAQGRDHGGRHDGGGHGGDRGARGDYAGSERGGYAPRGGGFPHGGEPRDGGRFGYEGSGGYAPNPYERAPSARGRDMGYPQVSPYEPSSRAFRRGQYIPHGYWSGEIANPRSRHLRTPPPGYGWIGVGPNAYLMQRSTGLVLDSVPGAW